MIAKEERRDQILDSAEALIRTSGVEAVTMDEIARHADVSKGTLYLYFNNKQELLLGLHNRALEIIVQRCADVLSEDRTGRELLWRIGEEFVQFNKEYEFNMEIFLRYESLMLDEEAQKGDEGSKCQANASRVFSYITRCIQVGKADGSIVTEKDPKELAVLIWASGRGVTQLSYMQQNRVVNELMGDVDLSHEHLFLEHLKLLLEALSPKEVTLSQ